MRTRRQQMASRRRLPSLDYLESRNLLSTTGFLATETLVTRTSVTKGDVSIVTNNTIGSGTPLGSKFRGSLTIDQPNPAPSDVPIALTGGTFTYTTASGTSTLTGTFTESVIFYTDPTTHDVHHAFVETLTVKGGRGEYAHATGEISRYGKTTSLTNPVTAEDVGYINT